MGKDRPVFLRISFISARILFLFVMFTFNSAIVFSYHRKDGREYAAGTLPPFHLSQFFMAHGVIAMLQ
jgi:hypothetical protein